MTVRKFTIALRPSKILPANRGARPVEVGRQKNARGGRTQRDYWIRDGDVTEAITELPGPMRTRPIRKPFVSTVC